MIIPYRINTLFQQVPVVNWALIGLTSIISTGFILHPSPNVAHYVLDGWRIRGLIGHLFLHAGFLHLAGNMIFLWVFGNAINGNTNHLIYAALYFGFGLAAASVHNIIDGRIAIGASGAINGIVGMATAMYPLNRVSSLFFFYIKPFKFETKLWLLALLWLFFDAIGAILGSDGVAVWAHLGGFAAGIITGTIFLKLGIVRLTKWDNESLSEIIFGK